MKNNATPGYSFQEFLGHVAAMKEVRKWEHVSLGEGHYIGPAQTQANHAARVIDYFKDCYPNREEMFFKSETFLRIHDAASSHHRLYKWFGLIRPSKEERTVLIDTSLFHALHIVHTSPRPKRESIRVSPLLVVLLAKILQRVGG